MSSFIINKNFGFGSDYATSDGTSGSSAVVTMQQLAVGTTQQEPGMANQQNLLTTLGSAKSGMLGITATGGTQSIARYFVVPNPASLKGIQNLLVNPNFTAGTNCALVANTSVSVQLVSYTPVTDTISSVYYTSAALPAPGVIGIATISVLIKSFVLAPTAVGTGNNGLAYNWTLQTAASGYIFNQFLSASAVNCSLGLPSAPTLAAAQASIPAAAVETNMQATALYTPSSPPVITLGLFMPAYIVAPPATWGVGNYDVALSCSFFIYA
jgi:hypothetical protein